MTFAPPKSSRAPHPPGPAQLKGGAFLSTLAFVDQRFGDAGRATLLAALIPEDRALLSGIILPISWYPLDSFVRVLRAMDVSLGRADTSLAIERGTFAAIHDITTLRRALLKLFTPVWIISKAAGIWQSHHSTGRWEAEATGSRKARAVLRDLGVVDEVFCATMRGWIIGLFTLAGCTASVTHTKCRCHGSNEGCVFECTW